MKKRIKISLMAIIATLLIGCSTTANKVVIKPLEPKLNTIRDCGKFKYEKQGNLLILDYKVAKCIKKQLVECAEDRATLIVANSTNCKIIDRLQQGE